MKNSHIDYPQVSVILPVYNAEKYLAESIKSILCQTFTNFELIVLNDGSTDESASIINSFNDNRIIYVEQENMGLANTLNKGISLSRGKYIARQDNDDISHPDRLQRQVSFLDQNEAYALVGTCASIIDASGMDTGRRHQHPVTSEYLKLDLVFDNPFVHSSIMFRKETITGIGGYQNSLDFFEDHNLWSRVSYFYEVANLSDELLKYREVPTGMSKSSNDYSRKVLNQSILNLVHYLHLGGHEPNEIGNYFQSGYSDSINQSKFEEFVKQLVKLIFKNKSFAEQEFAFNRLMCKMKINEVRNRLQQKNLSKADFIVLKLKRRFLLTKYKKLTGSIQY